MEEVDSSLADVDTLEMAAVPAPIGDWFASVWLYDRSSNVDSVRVISVGDFSETDEELQSVEMDRNLTQTKEFPYNWKHEKGTEPFIMEICCTSLVLVYKDSARPTPAVHRCLWTGKRCFWQTRSKTGGHTAIR